jgi:Phasin protein
MAREHTRGQREPREEREQSERRELPAQWGQITATTFDFLKELGDINATIFGRLSRQQLDFLSASIEAGTRQLQLFTSPGGDYGSWMRRQASLVADCNERFAEIARESTSVVSEATERLRDWFQQGTAAFEERTETAARGVERAIGLTAERADEGVRRVTRFTERAVARGVERERPAPRA